MAYISLLYGSVRSERQGIKAARFLAKVLESRGHEVQLIDPMELTLPMLDKRYREHKEGEAPENMQKIAGYLERSEGFVLVTAEYNHSIPPALKNLLDHFYPEYLNKPSAIASYSSGSFGGVRAADLLRIVCGQLGMPSIPAMLPIPNVQDAFDEEGNAIDDAYLRRADRFFSEFEWYIEALGNQRSKGKP